MREKAGSCLKRRRLGSSVRADEICGALAGGNRGSSPSFATSATTIVALAAARRRLAFETWSIAGSIRQSRKIHSLTSSGSREDRCSKIKASGPLRLLRTKHFVRGQQGADRIQRPFDKRPLLFLKDPHHQSLRAKKYDEANNHVAGAGEQRIFCSASHCSFLLRGFSLRLDRCPAGLYSRFEA